jgi:hypothetical protein
MPTQFLKVDLAVPSVDSLKTSMVQVSTGNATGSVAQRASLVLMVGPRMSGAETCSSKYRCM